MTLILALVRHAKAAGPDGVDDHDRPLAARGRRDAPRMGAWLAGRGVAPHRALVSTARRTRETWDGLRSGGVSGEVTFDASLYHATSDAIRHAVAACPARAVLVLGHNPGIARLAEELARSAPPHGRFHDFPTCASLVLTFEEEDWTRALSARGDVAGFAVPADLGGT